MNRALILLFMVILCGAMAGCAWGPQAQPTSPKPSRTPSQTEENAPHATPKPTPQSPAATPQTPPDTAPGHTPEAEPADTQEDPYFYRPPAEAPGDVEIRIYKGRRTLELIMDGETAGRFPIGLGFAPEGDKERQGDGRTPVGEYYVCSRNDRSNYYLSLGVSYPNTEDAQGALESGLIDRETYERIADAEARRALPDWDTPLGGAICIHSGGSQTDWTWGCIATEDETMDILWEYCPHGTPILIYE